MYSIRFTKLNVELIRNLPAAMKAELINLDDVIPVFFKFQSITFNIALYYYLVKYWGIPYNVYPRFWK